MTRAPWSDRFDVHVLAGPYGSKFGVATGFDDEGCLVWDWDSYKETDPQLPPVMKLSREVLEALGLAAGEVVQVSDATVDALKDARTVRDRLLTLVEEGLASWR